MLHLIHPYLILPLIQIANPDAVTERIGVIVLPGGLDISAASRNTVVASETSSGGNAMPEAAEIKTTSGIESFIALKSVSKSSWCCIETKCRVC
jgi:hypothetical protein